jgi:hypothetical protein
MRLNGRGQSEVRPQVEEPQVKYIFIKGLKIPPQNILKFDQRECKDQGYTVKKAVEFLIVPSENPFPMTDWYVSST